MTTLAAIRKLETRAGGLDQQARKIIALVRYCPECEPRRNFVDGEERSEAELNQALEEQRELGAPAGVVIFSPLKIGECEVCGFSKHPEYA